MNNTLVMQGTQLVLVGLGLHAKRFHLPFLRKHSVSPQLIVDVEANRKTVTDYLRKNQLAADTLFLADKHRDSLALPSAFTKQLTAACKKLLINRAVIATEPKAHRAYAEFFVGAGIDVLVDKPLTTPVGATNDIKSATQIWTDYTQLKELTSRPGSGQLTILAQRRFSRIYSRAYQIVDEVIRQYKIPITFLDMYSTDGQWTMPPEFESRENHPYKYGYGTLMHAGYHFVDLVAWFMDLNAQLKAKRPNQVEVTSQIIDPQDFQFIINKLDYERFFGKGSFREYFKNPTRQLRAYGEVDSASIITYKRDDHTIALVNCSLLQNSFARRSWTHLPEDTNSTNGRVRHERLNIQVGPLLNVQVQGYCSYEVKDSAAHAHEIFDEGNIEQLDLTIYRNVGVIGGRPYEKVKISDLYETADAALGHRDQGNETCMLAFLKGKSNISSIELHQNTNLLMSHLHRAIAHGRHGQVPTSRFVYPQ